jgi:hypothetical protein
MVHTEIIKAELYLLSTEIDGLLVLCGEGLRGSLFAGQMESVRG